MLQPTFVFAGSIVLSLLAAVVAFPQNARPPMQTVVLNDVALGMPAMHLTIPAGWHFQGEVVRNVPCSPGDPFPEYRASSPDGSIVVGMMTPFFTVYPPQSAGNMNLRGCGMVMPAPPTGKILSAYVVPAIRKGVQASAPEPVPGTEELIRSMSGRGNMMIHSGGAARVRLSYDENGKPVEEYIAGLTQYTQFQGMPGGTSQTVILTVRAPQGQLEAFMKGTYSQILLTNLPAWQQRSANLSAAQTAQIQQQGAATRQGMATQAQQNMQQTVDRSNQTVQNIQRTGQAAMQTDRNRQQAIDNAAAGTAAYVNNKTAIYHWRQTSTGTTTWTDTPTAPGPGWVQIQ
jgi:hypothetical protein